ncbi:hypothetical protein Cadr_000024228 [Camelus dromedarius]|uniref:Uncharacterized protein n=1 Tax=Camelus dromedarius TaxID=9838 RepID=A0A5N4CQ77_CAMDR|nr:hypothetical protein Cadr_000024228 [Camelus dromedarius]
MAPLNSVVELERGFLSGLRLCLERSVFVSTRRSLPPPQPGCWQSKAILPSALKRDGKNEGPCWSRGGSSACFRSGGGWTEPGLLVVGELDFQDTGQPSLSVLQSSLGNNSGISSLGKTPRRVEMSVLTLSGEGAAEGCRPRGISRERREVASRAQHTDASPGARAGGKKIDSGPTVEKWKGAEQPAKEQLGCPAPPVSGTAATHSPACEVGAESPILPGRIQVQVDPGAGAWLLVRKLEPEKVGTLRGTAAGSGRAAPAQGCAPGGPQLPSKPPQPRQEALWSGPRWAHAPLSVGLWATAVERAEPWLPSPEQQQRDFPRVAVQAPEVPPPRGPRGGKLDSLLPGQEHPSNGSGKLAQGAQGGAAPFTWAVSSPTTQADPAHTYLHPRRAAGESVPFLVL